MATKFQIQNFINLIAPLAQKISKSRAKWVLPSVTIAMAALETGWGLSSRMMKTYSLFGFKVGSGRLYGDAWNGKAYNSKTKEFVNEYVTTTACFRAYDSYEDSIIDYMDLICGLDRYAKAVCNPDAESTITAIKEGGYATDPLYINSIMSIIEKYNLRLYDSVVTGVQIRKTINMWSRGEDVEFLQNSLNLLGFNSGKVDGIYGPITFQAVENFQTKYNLKIDGITGPETWGKISSLLSYK